MEQKTHWKNIANYDYLGAYSLEGIAPTVTLTISSIRKQKVTAEGGKEDNCIVVFFEEEISDGVMVKPMVLNKTNCKIVASLYGDYIEDWIGKKITIFATTTKFGRDTVPCLRVKKEVVENKTPVTTPEVPEEKRKCVVCGNVVNMKVYEGSMKKYGVVLCSKECLEKYNEKENKDENSEN